jgi:hypothetical protein
MRKTVMAVSLIVALAGGAAVFAAGAGTTSGTTPPVDAGYNYNKGPARSMENAPSQDTGIHIENTPLFNPK